MKMKISEKSFNKEYNKFLDNRDNWIKNITNYDIVWLDYFVMRYGDTLQKARAKKMLKSLVNV